MIPLRECPNGRHKFEPSRVNQIFCSIRCRNAWNNNAYKKELADYKKIMDRLRFADKNFDALFKKQGTYILQDHFRDHKVSFDSARQLHYDSKNLIVKAIYVRYQLTLIEEKIYKIEKI